MKLAVLYLFSLLVLMSYGLVLQSASDAPGWMALSGLLYQCVLLGGIGGVVYCLRSVYLNACVRGEWGDEWLPWYYIRPVVSLVLGGISWLFLKAGLLVLDASSSVDSSSLGFLSLAFIAGYNVDKFMTKLEQLSEATWGIEKSRNAKFKEKND